MRGRENTTAVPNTGNGEGTPSETSLLVDVRAVAVMLDCSTRHVYRLADGGMMPRPHKIGALCRWDRAAIESWIRDGCPRDKDATRA